MTLKQRQTTAKLLYKRLLQQFHAMESGQIEEFVTEFGERHLLGKFESNAGLCMMLKPYQKGTKGIVLEICQPENMAADTAILPYRLRDYFGFTFSQNNTLSDDWKEQPCYCVVARATGTIEICPTSLRSAKQAAEELPPEEFFWHKMCIEDIYPCDKS